MHDAMASSVTAPAREQPSGESPSSLRLQRLRVDKIAHCCLLLILLAAAVAFFEMIKAFLVPIILAAVFAGLFFPYYSLLLKRTHGRKSLSALVCCAVLSLGLLLPVYAVVNLGTREAVRLYQSAESNGNRFSAEDIQAKMQKYPLIRTLPMTFEHLTKRAAD